MNIVFLSPHFPPNYYRFCIRLKELGVTVLAVADESYERLRPELRFALTDYHQAHNMEDYDQLLRACGYFTHRYGKIDRIESLNEHWLASEARLRTDFNVFGIHYKDIARIKRKSEMKKVFQSAGIPVARGGLIPTLESAKRLIDEVGYPVVVKPDTGVGAAKTFRLNDDTDLARFFSDKPPVDYFLEEFVQGTICSFDGLTDREGHPVFFTSHVYNQGVMEAVNDDLHVSFYSLREIPADLQAAGLRTLRAFDVRERFFHFEFFRTADDRIIALEVNMRPPGGFTLDMFNYANDIDIYAQWANVIVHNRFTARYDRKYHCAFISRKRGKPYVHPHADVLRQLGDLVCHHGAIDPVFRVAMGDYAYLVRSGELARIREAIRYIQAMA
ncbi:ATP-grasp domain-containing protein [Heliobacterium undosum]|uniref:ATP-grasp domain-containing protein n=1 Tax=Heliomicrobium undosum TaxID=121734 RepID=A0A845L4B1_9FIRM|nr:ATP-grasp domain-containing protein [Heliomicrobium undosum]MZP30019.1 ATP-grasp domain-containing protein [Heliomicrobium undosum]